MKSDPLSGSTTLPPVSSLKTYCHATDLINKSGLIRLILYHSLCLCQWRGATHQMALLGPTTVYSTTPHRHRHYIDTTLDSSSIPLFALLCLLHTYPCRLPPPYKRGNCAKYRSKALFIHAHNESQYTNHDHTTTEPSLTAAAAPIICIRFSLALTRLLSFLPSATTIPC